MLLWLKCIKQADLPPSLPNLKRHELLPFSLDAVPVVLTNFHLHSVAVLHESITITFFFLFQFCSSQNLTHGTSRKCIYRPLLASLIYHSHFDIKAWFCHSDHCRQTIYRYTFQLALLFLIVHSILNNWEYLLDLCPLLCPTKTEPILSFCLATICSDF